MNKAQIKKISLAFDIAEKDIIDCLKKINPDEKTKNTTKNVEDQKPEITKLENFFYFSEEDLKKLDNKIAKIQDEISRLGQEIGLSVDISGETFHDNFVYEEGNRQQEMWSHELRKLINIKNNAKVFETQKENNNNGIAIGKKVLLMINNKKILITIGSYITFDKSSISYDSEFAKNIISIKEGEEKEFFINGKKIKVVILKINA